MKEDEGGGGAEGEVAVVFAIFFGLNLVLYVELLMCR